MPDKLVVRPNSQPLITGLFTALIAFGCAWGAVESALGGGTPVFTVVGLALISILGFGFSGWMIRAWLKTTIEVSSSGIALRLPFTSVVEEFSWEKYRAARFEFNSDGGGYRFFIFYMTSLEGDVAVVENLSLSASHWLERAIVIQAPEVALKPLLPEKPE